MRYSSAFNRDWGFYSGPAADRFTFAGREIPVESAADGRSAKAAFYALDSRGERLATREPDALRRALTCKASLNLHVGMWAEGLADGTMFWGEFRELARELEFPLWVESAVRKQTAALVRGRAAA